MKEEMKEEMKEDLMKLTIAQLKERCKKKGFRGFSKMKKEELIEMINK